MPSYSIGKSSKEASFIKNNNVPGVGAYNCDQSGTSKLPRGPTFVLDRSLRMKTDKEISGPGPTNYRVESQSIFANMTKGYKMAGKIRDRIKSEGPGPASYSIPKIYSSKQYSFGIRTQMRNKSQRNPGPGDYDIDKSKHVHAISFQQSKRPSLQASPRYLKVGPGDYNVASMNSIKNKFSFPKKHKFFEQNCQQKQKTRVPGPGAYSNISINNIKKQILAVRFGKSRRQFKYGNSQIPGPGAYSPTSSNQKRSPTATIGNSPRGHLKINKNPGPASYIVTQLDVIKKQQPYISIGKSTRNQSDVHSFMKAGPGSYNIDYPDRGRAYSITGRSFKQKGFNFPGPTSYSPKYSSQFHKTEMSVISRDKKFHEQIDDTPGPGTYNIQNPQVSKTFNFSKQTRKQETNTNPGPGTYELKQFIGNQVYLSSKK